MNLSPSGYLGAGGARLEYAWSGPESHTAPTLVFLHEGLGCVALWRDFPERMAAATGCGALVYSRQGYGASDPIDLPRPPNFMDREALIVLPDLLRAAGIGRYFLIGHSDGASIALIFAAARDVDRDGLLGLCLEAPHVFVEGITVESIARIGEQYESTNLRERLERYHGTNVDVAFRGWNGVWLNPEFRDWNIVDALGGIDVPVQVIQGADDEYGTLDQVAAIEEGISGRFEKAILERCAHSPHRDQTDRVVSEMAGFVRRYSAGSSSGSDSGSDPDAAAPLL